MANSNPSIFARFFLAIAAYFRVLFDFIRRDGQTFAERAAAA